jgi:Dehydrogenases with different specificities (related to short-chain alcohol dehydrogenases)
MSKRIAYVTAGMGGLGTAICQRLYRDGFTVVVGCGPASPHKAQWLAEQERKGFDFIASEGNVADWDSCQVTFDRIKKDIGPIDVLVNNAGTACNVVFSRHAARRLGDSDRYQSQLAVQRHQASDR